MPQLHDSESRGRGGAGMSPEFEGFARIFGIETEYGVSVTDSGRHEDAGQVALAMYRPIVSRCRSTNTYLTNGARLYLDVGSHPEYATAECRDPHDAMVQDRAGEIVMSRLANDVQRRMRAATGRPSSTLPKTGLTKSLSALTFIFSPKREGDAPPSQLHYTVRLP